jgi:hypothetical protein
LGGFGAGRHRRIERRAASISGRRSVKKEWQAARLLTAITLILTTLSGDDTERRCDGQAGCGSRVGAAAT